MLKVVFDTVVFVRSLINPHSFWGTLVFKYHNSYRLFLSKPVLMEILEVLARPEIRGKFRMLEKLDLPKILEIIRQAETVELNRVPRVSRDTKDDPFLATAKAAQADYLVSADKDLLDLKEYEGIPIIDAEAFLRILEGSKSSASS